jgi:hypothetical protein
MNGSLRSPLHPPRGFLVALLAFGLLGLPALSLVACGDSDEGQTPVCPENPPEGEECFTAPGKTGASGSNAGGTGGNGGSAGQGDAGGGGSGG